MPNKPNILNTLTREEIAYYRNLAEKKEKDKTRNCAYCGKLVTMRADQKYCCAKCRMEAHNEAARIMYEKLLEDRRLWLLERDEFLREISELKKLLAKNGIPHG